MSEKWDEVEVSNVSGGGYTVEGRGNRSKARYRGEWVTVNGNALTTGTTVTLSGEISVDYQMGTGGDDPTGIALEV